MHTYEIYNTQLTRADNEKKHYSNMLHFLRSKLLEKHPRPVFDTQVNEMSKSDSRSPSKYLSSERLKKIKKTGSRSPFSKTIRLKQ
jgi:hypothetical protein